MPSDLRSYRVFIASPGGLDVERQAFRRVLNSYNESDAIARGVFFHPVGWEITLPGVGRPQELINKDVEQCDYFILVLWDRWGTPPSASCDARFSSGSEEEYHIAWRCFEDRTRPMRQLVVLFRSVEPRQLSDPGPQLQKVLDFRRSLEIERKLLFQTFDDAGVFEHRIRCLLAQWLRDHENKISGKVLTPHLPAASEASTAELTTLVPCPLPSSDIVTDPTLVAANAAADDGRFSEAEALFAQATSSATTPEPFIAHAQYYQRIGQLKQARRLAEHAVDSAILNANPAAHAEALGLLGSIENSLGHLRKAESHYTRALAISERLDDVRGILKGKIGIATLLEVKGRYPEAAKMLQDVLVTARRLQDHKFIAGTLNNLGLVYLYQGLLEDAQRTLRESLALSEEQQWEKGIALACGNLGSAMTIQGRYDEAERSIERAITINEKLRRPVSIANCYAKLARALFKRGDHTRAEQMYLKALDLYERSDLPARIAKVLSQLALLTDSPPAKLEYLRRAKHQYKRLRRRADVARLDKLIANASGDNDSIL